MSGDEAYGRLRFEAGVHRVQRMPITDKTRMHTSTASVSVLPEPEKVCLPLSFFRQGPIYEWEGGS